MKKKIISALARWFKVKIYFEQFKTSCEFPGPVIREQRFEPWHIYADREYTRLELEQMWQAGVKPLDRMKEDVVRHLFKVLKDDFDVREIEARRGHVRYEVRLEQWRDTSKPKLNFYEES